MSVVGRHFDKSKSSDYHEKGFLMFNTVNQALFSVSPCDHCENWVQDSNSSITSVHCHIKFIANIAGNGQCKLLNCINLQCRFD